MKQEQAFVGAMMEVLHERLAQDAQHGGKVHDDHLPLVDWLDLITAQIDKATAAAGGITGAVTPLGEAQIVRHRLIKIAALAVAGTLSIDRQFPRMAVEVGL